MSYTSTELIASIKRRASIPTSQNLLQTADFLALINDEIQINLVPLILSVRESYFLADYDYDIESAKSEYRIPTRAIGGKLADVQRIENGQAISLPQLVREYEDSVSQGNDGFYLKGNQVVLSPTPTATQFQLRLSFYQRPNTVVATADCAQVDSIDSGNNQVTVSSIPSSWTTGTVVDFIRAESGFECLAIDRSVSGVSGTTITFASLPTDLAVGDWIALAGESPIPQIPLELHSVLAQAVTVKCLEAVGDKQAMQLAEQKLQMMKDSAVQMLSPRVDGERKKLINPNSLMSHFGSR